MGHDEPRHAGPDRRPGACRLLDDQGLLHRAPRQGAQYVRDAGRGAPRGLRPSGSSRVLSPAHRGRAAGARGVRRVCVVPDARSIPGRGGLGERRAGSSRVRGLRRELRDDAAVPQDALLAHRADRQRSRTVRPEGPAGLSGHGRHRVSERRSGRPGGGGRGDRPRPRSPAPKPGN